MFSLVTASGTCFALADFNFKSASDAHLDAMALTVDFGDITPQKKSSRTAAAEIDEIFGNQYLKDKKIAVDGEDRWRR
jgi:hypothetical protein